MSWCLRPAVAQLRAIRAGKVTSAQLVAEHIDRIRRLDGPINAVVIRTFDRAAERAASADTALAQGQVWGPLHGLPITVKECFLLKGTLTTSAADELEGYVADSTALAVQRLLDAGAIVLGKTNVPPHAADVQTENKYYGRTNNPYDLSRTPGGSSGGSAAALACGFAALELGSDIAGSIRIPAHWCGVFGHKPSYGLGHLHGHVPQATHAALEPEPKGRVRARRDPSFHHDLAVSGPLARCCADLELALRVLSPPEPAMAENGWSFTLPPPRVTDVRALRAAAWLNPPFVPTDHDYLALLQSAAASLEGAGAEVDFEARPFDDVMAQKHLSTYAALLAATGEEFGGLALSLAEWRKLEVKRNFIKEAWANFFKDYDVLLCPVTAIPAMPHSTQPWIDRVFHGDGIPDFGAKTFNFWSGIVIVADLPATVVPIGFTPGGLPCGVQIVAPNFQDLTSLEVGKMLERCHAAAKYTPPPGFGQSPPAKL